MRAWSTSPRRSASSRLRSSIRTCSSLLTSVTPYTRAAAFPASRFSRKLPTVPRRVTAPSSADTAIAWLSTFGSQESSAATSSCRSSFVIDCLLSVIAAAPTGSWAAVTMARRYGPRVRHRIHEMPSPRRATGIGNRAAQAVRRSACRAGAPSTTIFGRYSGSSASPRVPSLCVFCLMAARRTRNFQDSIRFGVRALRIADRAGREQPPNPVVTSRRLSPTRRRAWGATGRTRESVDSTAVPRSALCKWKLSTPHRT